MPKIGTKLGIGIGTLITLCVVIGVFSYVQTRVVAKKIEEITEVKEPINSAVYAMENNLVETAVATLGYLSTGDKTFLATFRKNSENFEETQRRYRDVADRRIDKELRINLAEGFARFHELAAEQITLRDQQAATMEALIKDLDAIDALLTKKIVPSIKPDDPLAYRRLQAALEMEVNANAITKGLGDFLLTGQSEFESRIHRAEREFKRNFKVYQIVLVSSREARWTDELRRLSDESLERARIIIGQEKDRMAKLTVFIHDYRELGTIVNEQLQTRTERNLSDAKEDVLQAGRSANTRILLVVLASVVFGLSAGVATTKNITGPLRRLTSAMDSMARGERVQTIDLRSKDELRSLGESFNVMTGQLTRANEKLQESELRFRTMFLDAPLGIALVDSEGRFIRTNPALDEMFGGSESSLTGMLFSDLIVPDDSQIHMEAFRQMVDGTRNRYQMEIRNKRKDGRPSWISLNVSRMQHEGDPLPYSIMMMKDITARKATDQKLRLLGHTITSMNEGVIITDSEGKILSVNPGFLATYGYEAHEIIGRHVQVLGSSAAAGGNMAETFPAPQQRGWTGELKHIRKSGEEFPVLLSTSVVRDETGAPVALVGISRDITEQKRLEGQLREAEQERSADLRQFAISVQRAQEEERLRISRELHDDLCQRLSGMKFRVEALEVDVPARNKHVANGLRHFTQELDKTITEVRRISSNLRPSALDDFGLVTALRMLCKDFEKQHNIRTTFHLGDSALENIDPQIEIALYRIAQEALSNTARHANASALSLHLVREGSALRLIVEDDGNGFQWENVTRSRGPGHGLGLISMRERSELLGGRFEVDSVCDKGSTISVTIPMGEENRHEKNQNTHR